jgi:hypothetical protein
VQQQQHLVQHPRCLLAEVVEAVVEAAVEAAVLQDLLAVVEAAVLQDLLAASAALAEIEMAQQNPVEAVEAVEVSWEQ